MLTPSAPAVLPDLTDRRALARNRARATAHFLQDEVALEVQERLLEVNRRFTQAAVITAFPAIWRATLPAARIQPDDEVLALAPGGQDLVVDALNLHWANDPVGRLVQCRHALAPDGLFLGLLFGGQTLQELRACLAQAETEVTGGLSPRVLPMAEIRDLGGLLQRAGFALPVADSFERQVIYRDAFHLMADLRAMGEGNALAGRLRRPSRRAVLLRAAALYQELCGRPEGGVTARFEIICLNGWAPGPGQQQPLRPGSALKSLADALGEAAIRPAARDSDG